MATPFLPSSGRGRLALLGAAIGFVTFAGCGETTVNAPLPAARVEAVEGAGLSGPAGLALPDPVQVRVFGSDDQPLPGATVTFSAASGGSVDPATVVTDGSGIARTRWTLGQTAGANVLTATASGISTTITATVTAGRPATVTGEAGDNQTASAGTAVPTPPSVRVTDAFGNLVAEAPVSFSVLSGGGRVTNGLRETNSQGIATVGSWILGPAAGVHTLAARVEAGGVDNNPVVFTATATSPIGSQMVATAGNNQQAPVGRLVPVAPTVAVRNAAGDGVPGVGVTFEVTSGGGSVVGSHQITDATGTASVGGWFLGPLPGTNTLRASAPGLPAVTFTATGVAGLPVSMVAISQTTQTATAGTNVSDALLTATDWLGGHVQPTLRLGGGFKWYLFDLTDAENQVRPTVDIGLGFRGVGNGPIEVTAEVRYLLSSFDQSKLPTQGIAPQDQRQGDLVFAIGIGIRP